MQILTTDFETFYDREYSLSKMTTEEYVRDKRFEAILASVKVNDKKTEWYSGSKQQLGGWLRQFDWENSVAVAHNMRFDGAILDWHFGIRPKMMMCTMSMARAVHANELGSFSLAALSKHYGLPDKGTDVAGAIGLRRKDFGFHHLHDYGEYCCDDGDNTFEIFLKMAPLVPREEAHLISNTMKMFTQPVLQLNKAKLEEHLIGVLQRKATLLREVNATSEDIRSDKRFAALLDKFGVEPPMKVSPTTGKKTFAFARTDEDFKSLAEHPDERVQALVAARLGVKTTIEESRTQRFIGMADRGPMPVPLQYYAAHTGRFGGTDKINLQNLPRKSALKAAIEAPLGWLIVDCDSSQIEARVLAWLAGEEELVETFRQNNIEIANGVAKADMQHDPYKLMAMRIYNYMLMSDVSDDQRFVGKTTLLGSGYGMGWEKFQRQLKAFGVYLSDEMCQAIIAVYRQSFPAIPQLWRQCERALMVMMSESSVMWIGPNKLIEVNPEGIHLPNGMKLRYNNLRYEEAANGRMEYMYDQLKGKKVVPTKIYGAKVVENLCQALARIIVGEQINVVSQRYKVALTVHDSIASIVPESEGEKAQRYVEYCMRLAPAWAEGLPLNCESKMGRSYG